MNKNNNVLEEINCLSTLDDSQVLRDVHSHPGHYLRVKDSNTLVKNNWDTYNVTYNSDCDPTEICYFKGTSSHVTEIAFVADVSSSLNNTYFLIYSSKTGLTYHIWYNVNGAGTDPSPSGSTGIEVPIAENETAAIVAYATQLIFNSLLKSSFDVTRANSVLTITNTIFGEIKDTIDIDTGYLVNNTQGTDELIDKINISYDVDGNPIYKDVTLKGYTYNIVEGQFELDYTLDENTISNEIIYNINLSITDTEFSHTLSDRTKEYLIRTRNKKSTLQLAFNVTESGTNYITISGLSNYNSKNLKSVGRTLYFQTPNQPTMVEIIEKV